MARGLLSLLVLSVALACSASAKGPPPPAPAPSAPDHRSPLGTNLTAVTDWSAEWAFVDAFKMSREWISSTQASWDDPRPVDVDADGWVRSLAPGQIARTLMFWSNGAISYPAGDWLVTWEGNGTLEVWNQTIVSQGDRRVVVKVDPKRGGIGINLHAVEAGNYPKHIRVLPPGGACRKDEARSCTGDADCGAGDRCALYQAEPDAHLFHAAFLRSLKPYSVLRFMDWQMTNEAPTRSFAERAKPTDARYSVKGVPFEIILDLANRLDADPWLNVPDVADDAWSKELAALVKAKMEPGRKVWIEHSNEVWNGAFPQARRAAEQGQRLGLSSNAYEAQLRWHAQRSLAAFKAFEGVLGRERLVRVMGSHAANAWVSSTLLEHDDARAHTDVLAIAPYFGGALGEPDSAARTRTLSIDQLMDELESKALPMSLEWVRAQKKVADKHGVRLVAYEAGQHLVGVGPPQDDKQLEALFRTANQHPRMKQLYARYLDGWRAEGGTLLVHFNNTSAWSKYGSWGAQQALDSPPALAPKLEALRAFAASNQRWW